MGGIFKRLLVAALFSATLLSTGGTSALAAGNFDAFAVRDRIRRDLPRIHRCYESARRYEPALEGKVSVRFAVALSGSVHGVRVLENTTGNDLVERCVARVVSELDFPRRRSGKVARFTFPFVFAPQR